MQQSNVLYVCEIWAQLTADIKRLEGVHAKCQRQVRIRLRSCKVKGQNQKTTTYERNFTIAYCVDHRCFYLVFNV